MPVPPTLVVGAGVQGLSFALSAVSSGRPVIVVDKASSVGGQTRSFRYGNFTFDFGMHVFVTRDQRMARGMHGILREDFRSFRVRPASWLGPGRIVEDSQVCESLTASLPGPASKVWNCMRIVQPPVVVYPKRGGFGAFCERMAVDIRKRGGKIILNTMISPAGFEINGSVLRSVMLRGRRTAISGCYWAAEGGADSLSGRLLLYHFLVKGRPPWPYHWVRIAIDNPMLPSIVYYPTHFSAQNAPPGYYGVGAAIPLLPDDQSRSARSPLEEWYRRSPTDFAPWIARFLSRAGFFREDGLVEVHSEQVPLPIDAPPRRRHEQDGPRNFWRANRWLKETSGDSLASMQVRAAHAALTDIISGTA